MNQNEDLKSQSPQLKTGEQEVINAINLLVVNGYLLAAPDVGVLSLTNKLNRFYKDNMSSVESPKNTSVTINIPKITLREFRDKAEIPTTIQTATFKFNANRMSLEAERYFNRNVVGRVNMDELIEVTKAFYADTTQSRPTLSNYFVEGIWEGVLKDYKPKNKIPIANQSFTGERRL